MFDIGNRRLIDLAVERLDLQPGDAVLDIGCRRYGFA
jgi:cyclopropane fatty-acyl-phospholipid synthase-like methyltransferase